MNNTVLQATVEFCLAVISFVCKICVHYCDLPTATVE